MKRFYDFFATIQKGFNSQHNKNITKKVKMKARKFIFVFKFLQFCLLSFCQFQIKFFSIWHQNLLLINL